MRGFLFALRSHGGASLENMAQQAQLACALLTLPPSLSLAPVSICRKASAHATDTTHHNSQPASENHSLRSLRGKNKGAKMCRVLQGYLPAPRRYLFEDLLGTSARCCPSPLGPPFRASCSEATAARKGSVAMVRAVTAEQAPQFFHRDAAMMVRPAARCKRARSALNLDEV